VDDLSETAAEEQNIPAAKQEYSLFRELITAGIIAVYLYVIFNI